MRVHCMCTALAQPQLASFSRTVAHRKNRHACILIHGCDSIGNPLEVTRRPATLPMAIGWMSGKSHRHTAIRTHPSTAPTPAPPGVAPASTSAAIAISRDCILCRACNCPPALPSNAPCFLRSTRRLGVFQVSRFSPHPMSYGGARGTSNIVDSTTAARWHCRG